MGHEEHWRLCRSRTNVVMVSGIMYKCYKCLEFNQTPTCKKCGGAAQKACEKDHPCTCLTPVHEGVHYCSICGDPICPGCNSHDVFQMSRVTGYLQDVSGWNAGKKQELKDRVRYNFVDNKLNGVINGG